MSETPEVRPPLHNSSAPRDKEPVDLDKLMKWQEERMERRLRGEYESAVLHLSEVINDNMKTPVNISAVRIEGATHSRKSFLAGIIEPAVSSSSAAGSTTLEDVLHTTRRISYGLQKTDIFSAVSASLEPPQSGLASPQVGDVDLVFKTKERGRWYVSTATEVGNSEGTASASARVRNVFGGAETFEANMSLGTKTKRAFRATLTAPLTPEMKAFGEIAAYGLEKDLTTYASCTEALRGVRGVLRTGVPSRGAHEIAYEAVVRHVAGLSPTASISMREAAGTSIKSALSHTFLFDTRDDKIAATRGVYAKLLTELAGGPSKNGVGMGLGGDARHLKVEGEGQISRALGTSGVSLSLSARGGLLWGLGENGSTLFSDRFQLGGPTSVRSFKVNGLGPRDGDDSVGGELYYSAGVSMVSNIPTKSHWPVKTHAWINTGRLEGIDQSRALKDSVTQALGRPSISAGVGLIYRFDPIRVEVNFGVPLAAARSDGMRRGVQVGMGLEFM